MPKDKKLMIICFIRFKEYLHILNIHQDKISLQALSVLLTNHLESQWTLWCSKMCNNLFPCFLTDLRKESRNTLWETWSKTSTQERQQIFLNAIIVKRLKKLKKISTQYLCKLRTLKIYQNLSTDTLWAKW